MKKKNGFTVVEMVVSFSVTMIIMVFMFELVILVKDLYVSYGVKTELLTKQAILSEKINSDLLSKDLLITTQCGDNCIDFYFSDNTKNRLKVDRSTGNFQYGNYTTKLISGSSFGNIKISTQTLYNVTAGKNDSILSIDVPVYHKLLKGQNFGVTVAYQYKSYETAISDAYISDVVDTANTIKLIGSSDAIAFAGVAWSDPGYFVTYEDGSSIMNDPLVTVSGSVGSTVGSTYTVTYTLKNSGGSTISQVTRNVKVISNVITYDYHGGVQTFTAPVSGIYKLEVWGAQGGSSNSANDTGGKGGYAAGQIELSKDDVLNVYVGGQGNYPEFSNAGWNGGGQGGQGSTLGSGGGGATDIRFKGAELSDRVIVAGGGGGSGSYNNSTYKSVGGAGGGSYGSVGSSAAASYNGGAGSPTTGGAVPSYNTSITTAAGAGVLGNGGKGGVYSSTYGAGGGGGGYFGGAGGVRYGTGGGGSGFCSTKLDECITVVGTAQFNNVAGTGRETGHVGHGAAKITLVSITNAS